jgi:ribonucleoside-diphosphate reductase subunit M2
MDASYFSGFNNAFGMESDFSLSSSSQPLPLEEFDPLLVKTAKSAVAVSASEEPVLRENPNRFTLFPIMKPKLYKHYKNHLSTFWVVEEVDLTKDMKDWVKLTPNEQYFIKNVLGFFAGSDGIVQENLASRFMKEIQLPEARTYYSVQLMIEAIHSEMYSLLIDTYIETRRRR